MKPTKAAAEAEAIAARYRLPDGSYRVEVGPRHCRQRQRFKAGTPPKVVVAWRARALLAIEAVGDQPRATPLTDTLTADVQTYLRDADISKATQKVRTGQLAWWLAQDARVGEPVFTPAQVRDGARGPTGHTLGDRHRHTVDPKRLREILLVAFAPTDETIDPTEHASTSRLYRTALSHLYSVLDQDDIHAPRNPLARVKPRPPKGAQPSGEDMRIVAEILKHVPSKFGKDGTVTATRLAVLAWVHITPDQLRKVDPARDFHDVPEATREEIIGGLVTLTKRPRLKGRRNRPLPPPETIPLNPWGVEALRAFAALPAAWGPKMSLSPLNKVVKRAARAAQAALRDQGVRVDLSGFTLYHLKHSLATAAAVASGGVMDRAGVIRQDPGLQRMLDHTHGRTTSIYTQAAVDPVVRQVNAALSLHLDRLFAVPLTRERHLRIVATGGAR